MENFLKISGSDHIIDITFGRTYFIVPKFFLTPSEDFPSILEEQIFPTMMRDNRDKIVAMTKA